MLSLLTWAATTLCKRSRSCGVAWDGGAALNLASNRLIRCGAVPLTGAAPRRAPGELPAQSTLLLPPIHPCVISDCPNAVPARAASLRLPSGAPARPAGPRPARPASSAALAAVPATRDGLASGVRQQRRRARGGHPAGQAQARPCSFEGGTAGWRALGALVGAGTLAEPARRRPRLTAARSLARPPRAAAATAPTCSSMGSQQRSSRIPAAAAAAAA